MTGQSAASSSVETRSSAMPPASLPMMLAVAGAITKLRLQSHGDLPQLGAQMRLQPEYRCRAFSRILPPPVGLRQDVEHLRARGLIIDDPVEPLTRRRPMTPGQLETSGIETHLDCG